MTNYRYYLYVYGAEHYFEWQNATEGGIVFDMIASRSGGGYRHTPMLAYDLNIIQSPSVQSMYYSYWGQQMGTVYRDTDYNVFGVHSNISGDDTAFGYDVQLNYTTYGSNTAAMLHAIRDYFDSQSSQGQGIVTLDIPANGQTLKFSSSLLGKTINQFISGDAEVNFDGETVGITLEGGKGDEVAIYDGSTLLKRSRLARMKSQQLRMFR